MVRALLSVVVTMSAAATAQPQERTPRSPPVDLTDRLNAHLRAAQPPGANAWPLYRRILEEELGVRMDDRDMTFAEDRDLDEPDWYALMLGAWDDPRHAPEKAALERFAHLLPLLDEAAAAPGFARWYEAPGERESDLAHFSRTDLILMRPLARLNAAAFRAAMEADEWDAAVQRLRTGLAMGRHLSHQPVQIERMISKSVIALHIQELARQLNERDLDAPTARALFEALGDQHWDAGSEAVSMDMEAMIVMEFHAATREMLGEAPLPQEQLKRMARELKRLSGILSKLDPVALREHARANRPPDEWAILEAEHAAAAHGVVMARMMNTTHLVTAQIAALRLMLRMEIQHAETGRWPERLEDHFQPWETLEPTTGLPYRYRRRAQGEQGPPYTLVLPEGSPDWWLRSGDRGVINPAREDRLEPEPDGLSRDEEVDAP